MNKAMCRGDIRLGTACRNCERCNVQLTLRACLACGYPAWIKTVHKVDMVYVGKVFWHPLTNIHQAMQLLVDAKPRMTMVGGALGFRVEGVQVDPLGEVSASTLIAAQCRAIVGACAALYEGVESACT